MKWKWAFIRNRKHFEALSKGYIAYSLYPLAILHEIDRTLPVWDDPFLQKFLVSSMRYLDRHVFHYAADDNPYAFSYHPTGYEAACIIESFSEFLDQSERSKKDWVQKQIGRHYDFQQNLMSKNTCDPDTLAARLYEVTRLRDFDMDIE